MESLDWDAVVEDLGPRLYRYFNVRFSPELADDLTQETLIRLVRKTQEGKFDPTLGTLKMLGFGIAHYVALEARRDFLEESLDEHADSLVGDTTLEERTLTKGQAARVRDKIKFLSAIEQQVFALAVDEEFQLADIARLLQLPEGTVKSHLFRSKNKLFKLLTEEGA